MRGEVLCPLSAISPRYILACSFGELPLHQRKYKCHEGRSKGTSVESDSSLRQASERNVSVFLGQQQLSRRVDRAE